MKRFISHPATNAVCISAFTAFYALVFISTSQIASFSISLDYLNYPENTTSFLKGWGKFLASGYQQYIAYVLVAVTIFVVYLLSRRRRNYDEYHTSLLVQCLVISLVLTLITNALFFLAILYDTRFIIEKTMFFIAFQWTGVVLSDFVYVCICRWR